MFRLDANPATRCGGSWKKIGTNCLHLPETHQIIKLIRNFLEVVAPDVVILQRPMFPMRKIFLILVKG